MPVGFGRYFQRRDERNVIERARRVVADRIETMECQFIVHVLHACD